MADFDTAVRGRGVDFVRNCHSGIFWVLSGKEGFATQSD